MAIAPAVPVALKVSGEPLKALVAVSVSAPAAVASVQPTTARPSVPVVTTEPVHVPSPLATNVTAAPPTGLSLPSVTSTVGAITTVVPTAAVWSAPAAMAIFTAAPGVPVAWKVTRGAASPAQVAVMTLAPAVVPSVQPTLAMPAASVVADVLPQEPPPAVAAKSTVTPLTGLPCLSTTMTLGAVATAVPATAFWASPACTCRASAGPAR